MKRASALFALLAGLTTAQIPALAQSKPTATAAQRASVEPTRPLATGVRNFVFTARQASGWRQYAPRQTALFKTGETLQFYAEPVNLGWSGGGQQFRFEMRVDIEIRTPDGRVIWGQKDYGHLAHNSPAVDPKTYITGSVTVKDLPPGLYILAIRFRDPSNNRTAEMDMAFGVVEQPRLLDA